MSGTDPFDLALDGETLDGEALDAEVASATGVSDGAAVSMDGWRPVSRRLVVHRRLLLAVPLVLVLVVLVAGVALTPSPWWAAGALAWVVAAAWCWVLPARQVRALGYAERRDDLLVRKGIMFRTLVVVPYGRMQYVDVSAGPLERRLGIATVQLHTASAGTDAAIPGLAPQEAARLRDQLSTRGEARLAGL